jgi:hypothetical protein
MIRGGVGAHTEACRRADLGPKGCRVNPDTW